MALRFFIWNLSCVSIPYLSHQDQDLLTWSRSYLQFLPCSHSPHLFRPPPPAPTSFHVHTFLSTLHSDLFGQHHLLPETLPAPTWSCPKTNENQLFPSAARMNLSFAPSDHFGLSFVASKLMTPSSSNLRGLQGWTCGVEWVRLPRWTELDGRADVPRQPFRIVAVRWHSPLLLHLDFFRRS